MPFTIPAEVHSDDFVYETSFDALPWFEQASDDEIVELAECEWGGDYPADDVARHFEDSDTDVAAVFNYAARTDNGFECHVEEEPAIKWLKANKPELLERIGQ